MANKALAKRQKLSIRTEPSRKGSPARDRLSSGRQPSASKVSVSGSKAQGRESILDKLFAKIEKE